MRAGRREEPVAGGADRLVELVACVSHAQALPALPRHRGGPRALQRLAGRGLCGMARASAECDRGQRPAGGAELDVPDGRDEGARPAALRNLLCRELDLQLEQVLRRLPAVTADNAVLSSSASGRHARTRSGHPRRGDETLPRLSWMAGTNPAMTGSAVL